MRIVVIGATGNVGTSVLEALGRRDEVDVDPRARAPASRGGATPRRHVRRRRRLARRPRPAPPRRRLRDPSRLADPALARPGDALAHERAGLHARLRRRRRGGRAGARLRLVDRRLLPRPAVTWTEGRVDESWPNEGVPTSWYAQHKAEVERRLDRFEQEHPDRRVVRLRPALIMKADAAESVRRLFFGPFLPSPLVQAGPAPARAAHPGRGRAGRALARRRRGVRARGDRRRARRVQRRDGAGAGRPPACGCDRCPSDHDPGARSPACSPRRRGGCGSSRPRRTGSTSRSASRCSIRRGRARSSAGRRGTAREETARELLAALAAASRATRRRSAAETGSRRSRRESAVDPSEFGCILFG